MATIELTGPLAQRKSWNADRCSIGRALDVVRNRSAFLLLREAFYGASRFEEFVERTRLSEPVTSARLRELTDQGILVREPYQDPGQRTRHAYRLTDKGAELLPVLVALMRWGDRWEQEAGAPVELHHAGCGAIVGTELRCACGHPVAGDELELSLGPGSSRRARSAPR